MKSKYIALLIAALAVPAAVNAENVSVMVIEAGAGATTAEANASSWEDNIMDVFFNEGHIVSNARARRIASFPPEEIPEEALRDLQEASEGGSEYFVIAFLGYGESGKDEKTKPNTVRLRLYRVNPYRYVREEVVSVQGKATPIDVVLQRTRTAVKNMIPYMKRR